MTGHRDLLDAQAHERRRLAAALAGRPVEGPVAEPPRTGRAVVAGAVLAVLLVAGAAGWGLLDPSGSGRTDGADPLRGGAVGGSLRGGG